MRCANRLCPDRALPLRYAADGVHICPVCCELTRNGRHVQLDEFTRIDPTYQKEIGRLRQTMQEAAGHFDYLKSDGVQIVRA